jgi:hypothetical protein
MEISPAFDQQKTTMKLIQRKREREKERDLA